ncbi:MAG: dihydroorotate dehydrogenase electron transfer subunit [Syntrophothermus sp.]
MRISISKVAQLIELENNYYLLKIHSPEIASEAKPGQFCNIKVSGSTFPLLRRPFSICDVEGEHIFIMFHVLGEGTKILAHKKPGEDIDLLGPLGNGFNYDDDYETAILVGGGIGVAPFPFLISRLNGKKIFTFAGGRTRNDTVTYGLKNYLISTDDGSLGFKGNVIELLANNSKLFSGYKIKIFGCGPTPMLRALKKYSEEKEYNCEVSTECAMACGFGICQGCPIQALDKEGYYLVCKDGPVFDVKKVVI